MRGRHSRFAPLGVFLLCLFLTACFGGKGGGGGGNGGGGGQQVVAIGIQSVAPNSLTGVTGTVTFIVQVANMGGKDSTSTTTLTADLGNAFTIAAGSGGGNPGSPSWNCSASVGAQVNCTFAAPIAAHSTAPSLTINVNTSSTVSGSGFITFNVANPDGIAGGGASFTVNFTLSGSGGGGGVGGTVTITTPEPLISSPELVVAGTANARTTAILQANVVSGDNGAGIDWYVCVGSLTSTTGCGGANVLGGNSVLGTISPGGHSASGAFVTYTAPAMLPAQPDNNFVIITAQQPGTMGAAAGVPSATTVVPYIVQNNNEIPSGNQIEGANFVFRLRGFTSSGGLAYGIVGRFHVDGAGGVTNGLEDINIAQAGGTSVVYTEVPFTGTYNMVNSSNGTMNLTVTSPPWTVVPVPTNPPPSTMTFAFTLDVQAGTGKIIEAEPTGNYVGSGFLQYQYPLTVFNSTSVSGSYAFSLATPTGTGSSGVHHGAIGRLDLVTGASSTTGTVANTSTVDDDSSNPTQHLTGTYVLDGPTADHGTLTLTSPSNTSHSTFYVVNKRHIVALGSDPDTLANNRGVLLGGAIRIAANASGQQDTFNNTSLTGPFVFTALGETPSIAASGQGHASAMIGRFSGTAGAAGVGNLAGIFDINDGGTVLGPLNILGTGGSGPGDFIIGTDGRGRGVLNISSNASGAAVTYHLVFYFVSPGFGFLQEQPASDGSRRGRSGQFLFQTVTAPIALPPINITFEGGTTADTAASLHSVAVFQLNGATTPVSLTEMADTSQSGMPSQVPASTGTGTVTITDQTNGRGTVTATSGTIAGSSGAVIYVEDPAEWLIMGTDATLQEPQIITLDQ